MKSARFGQALLPGALIHRIQRQKPRPDAIFVLLDKGAAPVAEAPLKASLDRLGLPYDLCPFAGGETRKGLATVEKLARRWLRKGASRQSMVLGVGGGITTDVAGFTAAVLMRGARWAAIPTTLLGMADAAIGGKTAVNLPEGKNLVGAFHLPQFVLADVSLLRSLPPREWNCGLGEVVKSGLIGSARLLGTLERADRSQITDAAAGTLNIARAAARVKEQIVDADLHESGPRKLLNLGHTFGHALETAAGERRLAHGEAVALGLRCALDYGVALDLTPRPLADRIDALLQRCGLPLRFPGKLPPPRILATLIARDKKKRGGEVEVIVARRVGRCEVLPGQDPRALAGQIHRSLG